MKTFGKFFLTILFIPLFFLFLINTTVRFQFLNPDFWTKTLTTDVYEGIRKALVIDLERKSSQEVAVDPRLFKSLVTSGNLEDFTERNIKNFLDLVNGKTKELKVYIPLSKLPKGLIPGNLGVNSEEISYKELVSLFPGFQGMQIQEENLSKLGTSSTLAFLISLLLLSLVIYLMYGATSPGKRFVVPAVPFIVTGILTLVLVGVGYLIKLNMGRELIVSTEPAEILLGTLAPPLATEIFRPWVYFGAGLIIVGVLLVFFKKGSSKKS